MFERIAEIDSYDRRDVAVVEVGKKLTNETAEK